MIRARLALAAAAWGLSHQQPASCVYPIDILCVGGARLMVPSGSRWDDFFAGPRVSDDFIPVREQPPLQERDAL